MGFLDLTKEPAVHLRLPVGSDIARSADGKSLVVRGPAGEGPPFAPHVPALDPVYALLRTGAPLKDIRDAAIGAVGSAAAAAYMLLLQRLYRWRAFELPLTDEAGERAVALPQREEHVLRLAAEVPPGEAGLDRFSCLRRSDGDWILESPLAGVRFRFPDLAALDISVVRRALSGEGYLETGSAEGGPSRRALAQWEFHDLLYHWHNRPGWHGDTVGATYPFIGEIEPPPAVRPAWRGERIALPAAPGGLEGESFVRILERRRSERVYDEDRPISLGDLGVLLERAARIRSRYTVQVGNALGRTSDFELTQRPYPNGGASYELEIYLAVDRCDGLDSGFYHYDANTHELVRIAGRTPDVELMFEEAKMATGHTADPQVLLAISARFARVMWKYKSIAYGVTLRNVGALYQTLYLVATDLGLSPCGLGTGNSARFARVTGLDPVVEGTVGDFILGGPPQAAG